MNNKSNKITRLNSVGVSIILLLMTMFVSACGGNTTESGSDSEAEGDSGVEFVRFSAEELVEFDIRTSMAGSGMVVITSSFPGEVRVNNDQFVHIVPRVSGVVHSVNFSEGDSVLVGQVMAVLDSQELADVNSEYLASLARSEIAELSFEREENLYGQNISSEAEYLAAKTNVTEANIEQSSARQKLLSLGFTEEYILDLPSQPDHALVHYEIVAPMSGIILERHITGGEAVESNADAFAIADLSQVWVDLEIFQKDLGMIKEGQDVQIESSGGRVAGSGVIRFVRPVVGEETRTAIARLVLENESGKWRPGMFVTGLVTIEKIDVSIYVPNTSLIEFEGETVIFSEYEDGFTPRNVVVGRESSSHSEVLSGLEAGQKYVSQGAFALKAQLAKSELEGGHSH